MNLLHEPPPAGFEGIAKTFAMARHIPTTHSLGLKIGLSNGGVPIAQGELDGYRQVRFFADHLRSSSGATSSTCSAATTRCLAATCCSRRRRRRSGGWRTATRPSSASHPSSSGPFATEAMPSDAPRAAAPDDQDGELLFGSRWGSGAQSVLPYLTKTP